MSAAPAIEAHDLSKRFGDTVAVDGLDLSIPEGGFYGLLGPNGAGKSTTVSLLTGSRLPDSGSIRLLGVPLHPDDPAYKAHIGVVPEEPPLFERLRGREQLLFTARMFGLGPREANGRIQDLLSLLRLERHAESLVADYSRGMRKKLALACALVHAPRILFLDEPFEGVDALSTETLRHLLMRLTSGGTTVLLTTHILSAAEELCDRVGILLGGRLAREVATAELRRDATSLQAVFRETVGGGSPPPPLPPWLAGEKPPK